MRKCRNCGHALKFSTKGQSRGDYCSRPDCRRVRDRERKREQRARKSTHPVEAPDTAPVEHQADEGPATPAAVLDAPAVAPWGESFPTLVDLWHWALSAGRDPFGRDYFLVLCDAADAEPRRYPSPNWYGLNWAQALDANARKTGGRK